VTDISVIIASYNSAKWLPSTIESIFRSARHSSFTIEIIVVVDGSTDDTAAVVESLREQSPLPLIFVQQTNKGRFLARFAGIEKSKGKYLLIFDSRILMNEFSFEYLEKTLRELDHNVALNGHIETEKHAPLIGRFWDVPTYIFWGGYLSKPTRTIITLDNFDYVPKGTTCFFVRKDLFVESCLKAWPTDNAHLTSDDTKILRNIVAETTVVIDPSFSAIYRPRTSLQPFLKHSFDRGTLFVDSYAGTSRVRNVILWVLGLSPVFVLALLVALLVSSLVQFFLGLLVIILCIVAPAVFALFRKCPLPAVFAFLFYVVPFSIVFWAGLVRGLIVHRATFFPAHKGL